MRITKIALLAICMGMLFYSCSRKEEKKVPESLNFAALKGIRYFEVKRRFSNGLSFNETGFQLEPSWIIEFLSNDSVSAWNPSQYRFYNFLITHNHANVYNFAREYYRIKSISKDSLIMQRLEVRSKEIQLDYRSDVNVVYYSRDYIFNKLKTTPEALRQPSRSDTLFIKRLAERSNRNPGNVDSAFGARTPVVFTPLDKNVSARQIVTGNTLMDRAFSYNYLYPDYRIDIKNAYKDFAHLYTAIVDAKGRFYVTRVDNVLPDEADSRKKVVQGISDVYLRNLFRVTPGSTLGFPHSSEINLEVVGKK